MIALGNILEVTDSYDVPQALLSALLDANKRADLFNRILSDGPDLGADLFCDFFQEHYSDRKGLKQDFTPQALSDLTQALAGSDGGVVVDVCAGSGSMTIKQWEYNKGGAILLLRAVQSGTAIPLVQFSDTGNAGDGDPWRCDYKGGRGGI